MFTTEELRNEDLAFENWFENNYGDITVKPEWQVVKNAFKEVAYAAWDAGNDHAKELASRNWDY